MYKDFQSHLKTELTSIKKAGLYKEERVITSPQRADITVQGGKQVLNFCANNYLGLSDNKRLIEAAKKALDTHGYGMSSVRFICGTGDLQKKLEEIKSLYVAERLAERAKKQINDLIFTSDLQFSLSDELRMEWRGLYRQSTKNKGKTEDYIKAIKGLRTELVPYNDDGDMKAYEALTCGIVFTEEEKKLLDEAPFENPSDEYLHQLKLLQDKYLQQLYSELNEVPQGEDIDLETWLNDAISFFKQKEEADYEDKDTFFTAILEDVRDDLFGNSKYIRDAL